MVHRNIKSSNIMLDSNFNAKLGNFGLARLVDHELGSQTTVLAGTMGYLQSVSPLARLLKNLIFKVLVLFSLRLHVEESQLSHRQNQTG